MTRLTLKKSMKPLIERVATFGSATLVKLSDGSHELRGGGNREWIRAKEWVSLFEHEVLLSDRQLPKKNQPSVSLGW